jgi:hypothetical protein
VVNLESSAIVRAVTHLLEHPDAARSLVVQVAETATVCSTWDRVAADFARMYGAS